MDDYKKGTSKNYTAWDLNCRSFIIFNHSKSHKLKKMFSRMFRRTNKQNTEKMIQELRSEEL